MRKVLCVVAFVLPAALCLGIPCLAESPVWNPAAVVTEGKDAIVELITSVSSVVFAALAVVIGWRFCIRLFKRLGRSV